jgi:hypothetical protein
MTPSRLALAASLLIVLQAPLLDSRHLPYPGSESPHPRREAARLRAHFDSVDVELRHRSVLGLSPSRREARATLIGWLREYRDAGRFPVNDLFRHQALPFFRDSRGTLCAMAYLIERSGRGDLVDRIVETRNNAFIPELADDPDLRAWLDSVGLSVMEAARIQPAYEFPPPPVPEDQAVKADYALASIVVSGAALTTIGLNLISPSKSTGWAGVIAGSAAIIAGAVNLDGPGDTDTVAAANMIAGFGALVGGVYRLVSFPTTRSARGLSSRTSSPGAGIAITPAVVATTGSPRLGLAVQASF